MIDKLNAIGERALKEIDGTQSLEALEQVRISVLGKKGALSEVLKGLGALAPQERPKIGAISNQWKSKIEEALSQRKGELEAVELESKLLVEKVDTSLPARLPHRGALHPITQTTRKVIQIFSRLGFDVTTGPEVETEFLNFDAVNIPKDHPSRDMQDTFFMGPAVVLRTHTSAVQMRALRSMGLPIRILSPGAVYRCDHDATHSPMFHQVEGLWVDRSVRMSDLKGTLEFFAKEIFGAATKIRMRPSYFPFVEPGAEVDVSCFQCRGKAEKRSLLSLEPCRVCKGSGWLEILGAGMVHPRLFELAGLNAKEVQGFAFGIGIERVAMLLHRIPDLRLMFQGDVRFLSQF